MATARMRLMNTAALVLATSVTRGVHGLDNGLARLPPMGYNT